MEYCYVKLYLQDVKPLELRFPPEKDNGNIKFLTKEDSNEVDDRSLCKEGQHWLKKDIGGKIERPLIICQYRHCNNE